MSFIGRDFGERHARTGGIERVHDGAGFGRGEQPIAGERNDAKACRRRAKRVGSDAIVVVREIEIVHGPRQVQVRIGIKAFNKSDALVPQI